MIYFKADKDKRLCYGDEGAQAVAVDRSIPYRDDVSVIVFFESKGINTIKLYSGLTYEAEREIMESWCTDWSLDWHSAELDK